MDSYVRLFDARGRTKGMDRRSASLLCAEKNEAVARCSILHGHEQLFAAKYVTYLPSVEELERELARDRRLLEAGGLKPTLKKRRARAPKPRRQRSGV